MTGAIGFVYRQRYAFPRADVTVPYFTARRDAAAVLADVAPFPARRGLTPTADAIVLNARMSPAPTWTAQQLGAR